MFSLTTRHVTSFGTHHVGFTWVKTIVNSFTISQRHSAVWWTSWANGEVWAHLIAGSDRFRTTPFPIHDDSAASLRGIVHGRNRPRRCVYSYSVSHCLRMTMNSKVDVLFDGRTHTKKMWCRLRDDSTYEVWQTVRYTMVCSSQQTSDLFQPSVVNNMTMYMLTKMTLDV
jgi:hypothetical protein